MKKILILSNMYPSKRSKTFGIFVKNQVEALREKGIPVDVVAAKEPRMKKIYVIRKYIQWMVQIAYVLLLKHKRYNIVHAHYVFPSGFFGLIFKKLFNVKLIVTAHGGDINRMARINSLIFRLSKKILQEADHVIAAGQGLKNDIEKDFEIDEKKITLMSMGVDRKVFSPIPILEARRKIQINEEGKHILFVGNIIKAKGLEELLSAFKLLSKEREGMHLHIMGEAKDAQLYETLQQRIVTENISNVEFHAPLSQNQLAHWMAGVDLFVLPSHLEGLGLVALEAMSCHTPVVGTDVGGLSFLLREGGGTLVEVRNSISLYEGMKKVMDNREIYEESVVKGEALAEKHNSEKIVDQLIELYGKV